MVVEKVEGVERELERFLGYELLPFQVHGGLVEG